jgi:uncharacterized protein
VNDNAMILPQETLRALSDSLARHEQRTGNQVVVLTVKTLDGEDIEGYANRVFNEWKLGQKDKDNGILIVVVPEDRRMRIEVGYGLEGTMTDLMASRIIRDVMTPRFREGDYGGGLLDGAMAVVKVLEGETLPEATGADMGTEDDSGFLDSMDPLTMPLTERILIGAFIFGIIGIFTFIGILTPGFGWFLYFFLIPFWATFPIIVLGTKGALICLISYMVLFPILKVLLKKLGLAGKLNLKGGTFRSSGAGSGGSWVSRSSSWSSSSSSGSSGFSGGGGSSGGGGASGGW